LIAALHYMFRIGLKGATEGCGLASIDWIARVFLAAVAGVGSRRGRVSVRSVSM